MKTLQEKIQILRQVAEKMREAAGINYSDYWNICLDDLFSDWKTLIEENLCSPGDVLSAVSDLIIRIKNEDTNPRVFSFTL